MGCRWRALDMAQSFRNRRPRPSEGATFRGDRATGTFEDICNRAIPAIFYAGRYTKAVRHVAQCNY